MEIEIDEQEVKKLPREVEDNYLGSTLQGKRSAKSFMGKRATVNLDRPSGYGRLSDEKPTNLSAINERPRDSEVSRRTGSQSGFFGQSNQYQRQTTRKSDTQLPLFGGGNGNEGAPSIAYFNEADTPTNSTLYQNSGKRNKSTTLTANDPFKIGAPNQKNDEDKRIDNRAVSQTGTEMNIGPHSR